MGLPAEYEQTQETMAADTVKTLADWIAKRTQSH
jgi:hypothetical protein